MKADPPDSERDHRLKNYLAIILGYADFLLDEIPDGDPRRHDVREIQAAATAAAALLHRTEDA